MDKRMCVWEKNSKNLFFDKFCVHIFDKNCDWGPFNPGPSGQNLHANKLTYPQRDSKVLSKLSIFENVSLALPIGYFWAQNYKSSTYI